jgi:DNA invertase Pin-like site-specific DNA recombinase
MLASMAITRGHRAVIYARESLDKWGDERAVERFVEQCRQLVQARGLREVCAPIIDNDVRASNGNKGTGFAKVKQMLRDGEADYVIIPVIDRMFRTLRDLEDVIDICLETGAALVAASGEIDLGHDQGRLMARVLTSFAKAETERKGQRQRDANDQAAKRGQRRTGGPRPFGYEDDHVTPRPAEAEAVAWAADALLAGASVSAVMREWRRRGLVTAQGGKPPTRQSVITIMRNPRNAGLAVLPGRDGKRHGEITGAGQWEPILAEETWRAVDALLAASDRTVTFTRQGETITRKIKASTPRGVRSLLGGLAACPCGNVVEGGTNHRGDHVYRCRPATRDGRPGPHVAVSAGQVDRWVEAAVTEALARPDLAGLVTPAPDVDTAGLRAEAAAIRKNLDVIAGDEALGLKSRSQVLAATGRGNARLAEISAGLAAAAGKGALAPFTRGEAAAKVWDQLDLSRRREVIRTLTSVTLYPAGRGARSYDLAAKVDMPGLAGREASELHVLNYMLGIHVLRWLL